MRKKARQVIKRIKKAIGVKWYRRNTDLQNKILNDIQYMTEGLVEFLYVDNFLSESDYLNSIDSFLRFETKTFNYPIPLVYEVGNMKQVSSLIYWNHQFLEVRKRIGLK